MKAQSDRPQRKATLSLLLIQTLQINDFTLVHRPMVYIPLLASDWEPRGKHVLITGGSQGLGLALAKEVSKRGADVTIVARSVSKLEKAVEEVQVS